MEFKGFSHNISINYNTQAIHIQQEIPSRKRKERKKNKLNKFPITNIHIPDLDYPKISHWINISNSLKSLVKNQRLGLEILKFQDYVALSDYEYHARAKVVERLQNVIQKYKPNYSCVLFGSSATDLCFVDSDIDITLVVNGDDSPPPDTPGPMASKLSKILSKIKHLSFKQHILRRCKVPIIKLVDELTRLHVDISYRQNDCLDSVTLIKNLCSNRPMLKPIVLVLKMFLQNRNLNTVYEGGIGGFSLVLMVNHFLTLHPQLYPDRYSNKNYHFQLGSALLDFFHFYGTIFNYQELGFDFDGNVMQKKNYDMLYSDPFLLCIQDPSKPTNDISKASSKMRIIAAHFKDAYLKLVNTKSSNPSLLIEIIHLSPEYFKRKSVVSGNAATETREKRKHNHEPFKSNHKKLKKNSFNI